MIEYWISSADLKNGIYIPKYYDPKIGLELDQLAPTCHLVKIEDLISKNALAISTGDEIGKAAYGTGNIPFVRTSDISNWEIITTPKQGISEDIYNQYRRKQDVKENDILLVRDGTYLIGTNCFVTTSDKKFLYQSHILKFRVSNDDIIEPMVLFLSLNSGIVQQQIRSVQFTADIIDTIGNRFRELILPVPRSKRSRDAAIKQAHGFLNTRLTGKCFIKQIPILMETVLKTGSITPINEFLDLDERELGNLLIQDTVTLEFGGFDKTWISSSDITNGIYLPKYYDPEIEDELKALATHCDVKSVGDLVGSGRLAVGTGDEPGKMAYGTGEIPFLRTTDFANWEIKHDPKHSLSEEIYQQYAASRDVQPDDILLVRDGTYLVGSSTIILHVDAKCVYCGGLYKIRSLNRDYLDPYLLLGLLNSYVVKRQIRSKQFTRDVIDTLGKRLNEVRIPIPRSKKLRREIANHIKSVVVSRLEAREGIRKLAKSFLNRNWQASC